MELVFAFVSRGEDLAVKVTDGVTGVRRKDHPAPIRAVPVNRQPETLKLKPPFSMHPNPKTLYCSQWKLPSKGCLKKAKIRSGNC